MKYKLIDNIPVPYTVGKGGRSPSYPFRTMKVGQCFELFTKKEMNAARNAAYREKVRNPSFNYGAVEYGEASQEYERDEEGDVLANPRRVWGRLWRVPAEEL